MQRERELAHRAMHLDAAASAQHIAAVREQVARAARVLDDRDRRALALVDGDGAVAGRQDQRTDLPGARARECEEGEHRCECEAAARAADPQRERRNRCVESRDQQHRPAHAEQRDQRESRHERARHARQRVHARKPSDVGACPVGRSDRGEPGGGEHRTHADRRRCRHCEHHRQEHGRRRPAPGQPACERSVAPHPRTERRRQQHGERAEPGARRHDRPCRRARGEHRDQRRAERERDEEGREHQREAEHRRIGRVHEQVREQDLERERAEPRRRGDQREHGRGALRRTLRYWRGNRSLRLDPPRDGERRAPGPGGEPCRGEHGAANAQRHGQPESRQQHADDAAGRVERVDGAEPAPELRLARHDGARHQRQRRAHRDAWQTERERRERELEQRQRARRFERRAIQRRVHRAVEREPWQDRQRRRGDGELHPSVAAQRPGPGPTAEASAQPVAERHPEEVGGEHGRGGARGAAEHEAEAARPHHLVDERRTARRGEDPIQRPGTARVAAGRLRHGRGG